MPTPDKDMRLNQNIPVAIALGVVGSFCFALSAKVQHSAVGEQVEENHAKKRMTRQELLRLMKEPNWWAGLGLMGVSLVFQVLGLTMAPVSIVQPVGLLAFPWSVILAPKSHGSSRFHLTVLATSITVLATVGFVLVVAAHSAPAASLSLIPVAIAAGIVYVIVSAFVVLGSRGPRPWRSLFWASGGAMFYGLEAALVKSIIDYSNSDATWWRDPLIWVIGAALILGSMLAGLMVQQGYATGPAEIVVGSMTATSPVVAVIFGIAVLHEGSQLTPMAGALMIGLGAAAIAGVVALTRVHPDYLETQSREEAETSSPTQLPQ